MALVTICKYRRAKTPYFLEQAGLNMYSLEELAWFLYHNICLAEPQMFDDRLCRWLEEEIGSSELARRIRNGKESGTNFQNLVISLNDLRYGFCRTGKARLIGAVTGFHN